MRRDVIGVAVAGLGVVLALRLLRSGQPPSPPRPPAGAAAAPAEVLADAHQPAGPSRATPAAESAAAASPSIPRTRTGKLRALRRAGIVPHVGPDGKPQLDAGPVIELLNKSGVHEGIAAFPPPGTDPPKAGLIVPEGIELPAGFVRHYQSTDDGESLPPILMLHPDYELQDEQGNTVPIPADRVVPPEFAPPGIPGEMLAVPTRDRSR